MYIEEGSLFFPKRHQGTKCALCHEALPKPMGARRTDSRERRLAACKSGLKEIANTCTRKRTSLPFFCGPIAAQKS
jgi:hypothetical protein